MSDGMAVLGWRPGWRAAAAWLAAWIEAERGRFVPWLAVFMTAGNALYFALRAEPAGRGGALALLCACALAAACRRWQVPRALAFCAVAAALGFAAAQVATWRAPPLLQVPRRGTVITGRVRAVETLPQGVRITLEAPRFEDGPPQPRRVRLRLRAEDPALPATGDLIRLRARLSPPAPPSFPGGWDLQRDAFFAGMGAYGYALTRVTVVAHAAPDGMGARLQALRETIAARIASVLPGDEGAICATLLTGSTAAIPEADRAAFRDSGLAHLLAIAGLHIGIVMGLVFGAVRVTLAAWERAALRWPCKPIAAVAALAAGGGYMLLTGAHVPIIRSFAMACLVTLGIVAGRRAVSLRGLALAMAVLLLIAPAQAMGVSFQMSFSAVLALISGYEALRPALSALRGAGGWRGWVLHHLATLALTSALAGTASAPFAAYHFGQVQIYNVLANVAAVPLTAAWIMPAGLIALALMPLHLEALALIPMGWGVDAVLWIGRSVSVLPEAVVAVPHAPPWGLAVTALGMAWLGLWRTRMRLLGVPVILAGLASPAVVRAPDVLLAADGRLAGLHANGAMYVQEKAGSSGFTLDTWRRMWAAGSPRALPDAPEGGLACDESGCTLRRRLGGPVLRLLLDPEETGADCRADAVVSLEPIRWRCPPPAPVVVDRFSLWRNGAHAVWLDPGGVRVLSDRAARGVRPWVAPPPGRPASQ
ncbi:MAG TPA: ComEC/Rec2 family competence protein [Acetobacteraceae bacterium]|nr:ComEC/Rec2 family competence protein [Acetobacteraceae bacterium]